MGFCSRDSHRCTSLEFSKVEDMATRTIVQEAQLANPGDYVLTFNLVGDWLTTTAALDGAMLLAKPVTVNAMQYTVTKWEPDYSHDQVLVYLSVRSLVPQIQVAPSFSAIPQPIATPHGTFVPPVNQPQAVAQGVVIIAVTVGVILGAAFLYLSLSKIEQITGTVADSPALSLTVVAVVIIAGVIVWKTVLR